MKKYLILLALTISLFITIFTVYSKPVIPCLVNCNKLFIGFNAETFGVEGLGDLNCGNGNQFCEFYTLFTIWYYDNNEKLTYLTGFCNGGAFNCGVKNYPIIDSPVTLQPGYKYMVRFSLYDVNNGCGTCSNPVLCNPTCSIAKTIDLR